MIPITSSLSTANASDIHENGNVCTKFVVPSIGSMNHVGALVNSGTDLFSEESSSPINLSRT